MVFFASSMALVAYSFQRVVPGLGLSARTTATHAWRMYTLQPAVALLIAWLVFTLECILFNNPSSYGTMQGYLDEGIWWRAFVFTVPRDFAAPILAMLACGTASASFRIWCW